MIARERFHPCPEKGDALVNAERHKKGSSHDPHAKEQGNKGIVVNGSATHNAMVLPNMAI